MERTARISTALRCPVRLGCARDRQGVQDPLAEVRGRKRPCLAATPRPRLDHARSLRADRSERISHAPGRGGKADAVAAAPAHTCGRGLSARRRAAFGGGCGPANPGAQLLSHSPRQRGLPAGYSRFPRGRFEDLRLRRAVPPAKSPAELGREGRKENAEQIAALADIPSVAEAGRKGGRRKQALQREENPLWRSDLVRIANAARKADPSIFNKDIIERVKSECDRRVIPHPEPRQMGSVLSDFITKGIIPPRKK